MKKLTINRTSDQKKCERVNSITHPNWSRLLKMKWLPTDAAEFTYSVFVENKCQM